jgi:serine/threonine protein kinase
MAVKHLKVENRETASHEFLRRVDSLLLELHIMHHGPLKSHPNILTFLGYGWNTEAGGVLPYILVEYSANGTLRDYLRVTRDITLQDLEMFIADVAAGIHALHTTGVIHGDVKLENVLVFNSNERKCSPTAKVCDFGHSILMGSGSDDRGTAIFTGTKR